MKKNIRDHLPDITVEQIQVMTGLTCYGWLLVSKMYNGGRIGACEISDDDLLKGFRPHLGHKFKEAIEDLEKKGILVKKPKPGVMIYQSVPTFYTDDVVYIAKAIRENRDLHDTLQNDDLELEETTSDILTEKLHEIYKRNKHGCLSEYSLRPSDNIAFDGKKGVVSTISFICPVTKHPLVVEFEILDPHDLYSNPRHILCDCGREHWCYASAKLTD
ncbi:MAG: hypothetical protein LBV63_03260 [Candidatus Methanoplasma sp.]|nr:hypothetical protein [Candidatus Methanoplasma sp.]